MNRTLPTGLVAALFLATLAPADDSIDDLRKFDGSWAILSQEENGMSESPEVLKKLTVVFDEGRYELKAGERILESGSLKLDAGKSPRSIDFKILKGESQGKTQLGIYRFEGDSLKLCVSVPAGSTARPTELSGKEGSQALLMVMKKKAP